MKGCAVGNDIQYTPM